LDDLFDEDDDEENEKVVPKDPKLVEAELEASRINVRNVVWNLKNNLLNRDSLLHDTQVIGALYHLKGNVEWIESDEKNEH